jgi:outer membrane protein insertion porin family
LDTGDTFNADELEETIVAMTDRLGELGYAFVEIDPQLNINRETQTVDVVFVVDEGPRVYVERIEIIGNVRTLDRVIRREFRLAEGDAFNSALLRRSEERLRNLGFFESVETRRLPGSFPDRTVIEVQVAERSTGELSFGVGFSTQDGPLGDVRLSERNFLGRGQQISAEFTLSGRRQEIDFSFTEPWFLGYEFAAGFDLFSRRTDFESEASFQDERIGGRIRGGYRLTERLRHDVRLTVQEIEIKDVDDDASVFIKDEEGSNLSVTVGQTLTYDRRNSPFLPSSGYILTAEQDIGIPGTPSQYIRHEGSAGWYYPFTPETVLNLGARGGVIFGYGGDDVRLGDRFFIGGSTLRGFKFAGIGPRDQETDDALGGNEYVTGTAELRFPLGLPDEIPLFGRVFGEGGTLTGIDVNGPTLFDDDALRASLGVGVSWLSPLGPISVDLAQAVLKSDEDRTEIFRLSFGTRF